MYKLIAIDIDGTLLNSNREITQEVAETIQAVREKGIKVVLCTGRPIGGIKPFVSELGLHDEGDYAITFNGALVQNMYTEKMVSGNFLTYDDLKALYELSEQVHSPMHYFDLHDMYTPNKQINRYTVYESFASDVSLHYQTFAEVPKDIQIPKVMFIEEEERLNEIIAAIPASFKERYMMVQSTTFFLEIMDSMVSKGSAVKQLAEKLSIPRSKIMCIGDNDNDLSMIEYAGCGVAMANATTGVKEAADFHTLSNDEDGVAHALKELVLG